MEIKDYGVANKLDSQIRGRSAIVTGSSRGIGRATAIELAKAGFDICLTYKEREAEAESAANEIRLFGRNVVIVQLDISRRDSVKRMIDRAINSFGHIDVLVNNAGILRQKQFLAISDEEWDKIIETNLKGTFICSQEVFPLMQRQGQGRIINIASSGGQLGGPLAVHYSASKAGVICLTKSLARIGAPDILVNCISPGLIETEMTEAEIASEQGREKIRQIPLGRPGLAEEVASVAVFLASGQSSYITGQTISVNGGLYMG